MTKKQVDNFKKGKSIPYCQLKAELSRKRKKQSQPRTGLEYQLTLKGAKHPKNIVTIDVPVRGTYMQCIWLENLAGNHMHQVGGLLDGVSIILVAICIHAYRS